MGTVYRKTYTKPLPADAEIITRKGERLARWRDAKGKTRTAPITVPETGNYAGQVRLVLKAGTFTAKYRDGSGVVRETSTGCRDETAARSVLADLERRAELVKAKVLTAAEDAVADHQDTPLAEHVDAYLLHLEAAGVNDTHRANVARHLRRIAKGCRFERLRDLERNSLERWLTQQTKSGMGARTRNMHLASALAFANWCTEPANGRLAANPFCGIPKADERADCRRKRRALTEDELTRLLEASRKRPLLDAMTIRRGKRKGQAVAKIREDARRRLETLGRERALIYKTAVLTGMRKKELASLTVGQLELDGPVSFAVLEAADEKNREGSQIALRTDLAADLRQCGSPTSSKLSRAKLDALASRFRQGCRWTHRFSPSLISW